MKPFCCFLFFLIIYSNCFAQGSGKYIRVGGVPYQLLSRSAGLYVSIKKPQSYWEYRPTYTFATGFSPLFLPTCDRYFYQGINNNFVLKFNDSRNVHARLLLIQRTWWYKNKFFSVDNIPSAREQVERRNQSSLINGFGIGADFYWDYSLDHLDYNVYLSLSGSYLYGKRYVVNPQPYSPSDYKTNLVVFNLTLGMEIGYRKELQQKAN